MKKLYEELLEREKYLKSLEKTSENLSRINELLLVIIRVQQLMLDEKNLKNNL